MTNNENCPGPALLFGFWTPDSPAPRDAAAQESNPVRPGQPSPWGAGGNTSSRNNFNIFLELLFWSFCGNFKHPSFCRIVYTFERDDGAFNSTKSKKYLMILFLYFSLLRINMYRILGSFWQINNVNKKTNRVKVSNNNDESK